MPKEPVVHEDGSFRVVYYPDCDRVVIRSGEDSVIINTTKLWQTVEFVEENYANKAFYSNNRVFADSNDTSESV
jgi:hypothetical protein